MFLIFHFIQIVYGTTVSSTRHSILTNRYIFEWNVIGFIKNVRDLPKLNFFTAFELTLQHHSLFNALLESTILASIPLRFRYFACSVRNACVDSSILYCSFEKSFATDFWDEQRFFVNSM